MIKIFFSLLLLVSSFFISKISAVGEEVVINEVAWGGTAASAADEWIELYNPTGSTVDLTGWTLVAADDSPNIVLSGTIAAGGFFLLERSDENTVSDIGADQTFSGALDNSDEYLVLKNGAETTVDAANGDGGPWPAGSASPNYYSMERIDPLAADTDDNWTNNDGVTRNGLDANGNPLNGTPKNQNSVYVTPSPTPILTPTPTLMPTPTLTPTPTPKETPCDWACKRAYFFQRRFLRLLFSSLPFKRFWW